MWDSIFFPHCVWSQQEANLTSTRIMTNMLQIRVLTWSHLRLLFRAFTWHTTSLVPQLWGTYLSCHSISNSAICSTAAQARYYNCKIFLDFTPNLPCICSMATWSQNCNSWQTSFHGVARLRVSKSNAIYGWLPGDWKWIDDAEDTNKCITRNSQE